MRTTKRRFEPAVIERLFKEPYRFEYFQALRVLELWLKRHGIPEQGLISNILRFQNSISLSFPPSQIEALHLERREIENDEQAGSAAPQAATLKHIRITPSFMGLLGGHGALPAHYTELIAEHQIKHKDEGPRAFLDIFSNRSLALFHEAWRKYRLELKYQVDGKDRFLPLLLALAGLSPASLRKRLAGDKHGRVLDESIGYFAASMRQRPASATQITRVLSEYFGQPVRAEQFVGCWYEVPLAHQTALGAPNALLSASALAGARVWQRDLRLKLAIGPLDYAAFNTFLPGGAAAKALKTMLTMFTGVTLEYEVELVLRAADVKGASLAADNPSYLGWDSYLVAGRQTQDRNDVRYVIGDSSSVA
jgi:type VI secretion system protein ImpH